jgi:hypothetical protein
MSGENAPEPYVSSMYEHIKEPDDNGCSWCAYMKAGGCSLPFANWRKCIAVSKVLRRTHQKLLALLFAFLLANANPDRKKMMI